MALITREELAAVKVKLEEFGIYGTAANFVIIDVLEEVSSEKLLTKDEIDRVLIHCKSGRDLKDLYDFMYKDAAIEIQLPELWEQHMKMLASKEELIKLATFLSLPIASEEL